MTRPTTWQTRQLAEIARIYSGGTPSRAVAAYWGGDIPWASTAEVDGPIITSTKERITHAGLSHSAAKIAPAGTLLMAMYGQGKTRGKTSMLGIDAAMNQACAAIEPNPHVVNRRFLLALLRHSYESIRALSNAGSQENLSGQIVKRIPVVLPPLGEQAQIADAVDDAQRLEGTLEWMIAKKQAIKQGMMQQLLTGKTRLPGHSGEWTVRSIGDLAQVKAGGTPSTAVPRYWGGHVRWMSSGEIHARRIREVSGRITADGLRESAAQFFPVGTVLVALAGQGKTRGTVAVSRVALSSNQSIAGILPTGEHDSEFLYYNLDTRYAELRGESSGDGGRGGLNLTILKNLDVLMPPYHEQVAIAGVLSDVDDEIDALQMRLAKAHALKEGMMQELLTGRTRLIVEQEAAA